MKIAPASAPEGGHRLVERALQDVLPYGDDAKGGRQTSSVDEIEISQPIPIYRLGLDRLQSAGNVEDADLVGWRYLVRTEPGKFGVADLIGVGGRRVRFSSFSENSNSVLFMQALHVAQAEAARSPFTLEIRSIDIPSLYVSAIWMTTQPAAFVPYIAPNGFPSELLSIDHGLIDKLAAVAKSELARRRDLP